MYAIDYLLKVSVTKHPSVHQVEIKQTPAWRHFSVTEALHWFGMIVLKICFMNGILRDLRSLSVYTDVSFCYFLHRMKLLNLSNLLSDHYCLKFVFILEDNTLLKALKTSTANYERCDTWISIFVIPACVFLSALFLQVWSVCWSFRKWRSHPFVPWLGFGNIWI